MWKRFRKILRCPLCRGSLELDAFVETAQAINPDRQLEDCDGFSEFAVRVEDGQLLCAACMVRFPIMLGLPILLPYSTDLHAQFQSKWAARLQQSGEFRFADEDPPMGESLVRGSFSTEWLEYDYDGVIWELNYSDHEARFRKEVGAAAISGADWFLEVGCGLGLATAVAQSCSQRDCVGMDLSLAAMKAAHHFRDNPFLHFVQASAFAPPFADEQFDVIYSRGVLHHTYSTRKAFESVVGLLTTHGTFFLWLYGLRSIWSTPLRVALYGLEAATRPLISRAPDSLLSKAFLSAMAVGYIAFNRGRRLMNAEIQPLTFRRAVHAARDRFTPRYAHRHSAEEICGWFRNNGLEGITVLDWRDMPAADQDDFRRNVGVRAARYVQSQL